MLFVLLLSRSRKCKGWSAIAWSTTSAYHRPRPQNQTMNHLAMTPSSAASRLCLNCGMCCNGVLFRDVELQAGDDASSFAKLGLPVRTTKRGDGVVTRASQPCAMLCGDNRCEIYRQRPVRCREFECMLFKAVVDGEISEDAALKTIRQTQSRAEKVRRLLRAAGDHDETRPLTQRFQRTRSRFETGRMDESALESFADLTLAVHSLNLLLSGKFYPGDSRQ